MLVFVDEPKNIKVIRTSPEEGTRTPLGKINKSVGDVPPDLREKLEEGELSDIEQVLQLMQRSVDAKTLVEVGEFPAVCRRMYDYYASTADPIERRWILGAVLELLRRVRRLERQDGADAQ